jgi:hypothetical protein
MTASRIPGMTQNTSYSNYILHQDPNSEQEESMDHQQLVEYLKKSPKEQGELEDGVTIVQILPALIDAGRCTADELRDPEVMPILEELFLEDGITITVHDFLDSLSLPT